MKHKNAVRSPRWGRELARRVGGGGRFTDDRDAEARLAERVRHRVQRPMPVRQHRALSIEGVLLRILRDGEVVGAWVGQLVDDGMVHRQYEAAAWLQNAPQLS